jgi:alcohol dehydrogenase (cytochrome c)
MIRAFFVAGAFAAGLLGGVSALAQSSADLINDHRTPGDVLTYGMGYNQQRYSPLAHINRGNVKRLVPVWTFATGNALGDESQPLLHGGVMYFTTSRSTFAIDAATGKGLWRHDIEYDPDTLRTICCGQVNRGAAILDGKLFRTTLDMHVIALDVKTGKEVWKTQSDDYKLGYSMTVAPLVANGVVIAGVAGAEFGVRGYLEGYDPESGKKLWRLWTVPAPGEPGSDTWPKNDAWKVGGGSTWLTGSYDPELDLVYWGTGNPGPWNPTVRAGDNLYTSSVLAIRPKTGQVAWHYQFTPNDPIDFDGNNEMILADLKQGGQTRRVLMHADRNGFLYVIDRTNGRLLAANAFVDKMTWASGVDLKTGRPILSQTTKDYLAGNEVELWPAVSGGKNWQPAAYNPETGLLYANTLEGGWLVAPAPIEHKPRAIFFGVKVAKRLWSDDRGILKAIDPMTGKAKWRVPRAVPSYSGVLTTAGKLVFSGAMTGEFTAYDAETGAKLWEFQTQSGIIGQPVTWERDGKQYVTVASGIGGVYHIHGGDARLRNVPTGGAVWTFALFD